MLQWPAFLNIAAIAFWKTLLQNGKSAFSTSLKAGNGQIALDFLESEPNIDVILLDLEMPVMDGFETISHISTPR